MRSELVQSPKLSIVIRARNEATALREVFAALAAQRVPFSFEVILVDNESEDATRSIAQACGARIIRISKSDFTYGRALNLGVRAARGELCLLLSAHALPVGSDFLIKAVMPFSDPLVAAARCINSGNTEQLAAWHQPKVIRYSSPEQQQTMETGRRWTSYYPAATCAVIRKSVFDQVPFDETLEGTEDKVWASAVAQKGYKLVACAEAVYVYRRELSRAARFDKRYREHLALYRFNHHLAVTWGDFLLDLGKNLCAVPRTILGELYHRTRFKWRLLMIPRHAAKEPSIGSLSEFARKNS
jgi:glycosyltransferase involved in cell wall biosynthesis